jgi:ubiquinone biosynthesis protein Coq4
VPEIAQMVDEAWEPPHLTLAELSRMPEGSLGHIYAQRMLADGLDPDVIRRNAAAAALEPGESDLARKALAQRWELGWERPLADLGLQLAIEPART